jgi:hypothetical protein
MSNLAQEPAAEGMFETLQQALNCAEASADSTCPLWAHLIRADSTPRAACRYDGVMEGPIGPAVSATLGQMLDDFFQYAAELQQSLEEQGEGCMGLS